MLNPHPKHARYALRPTEDEDISWMWPASAEALRPYVEPVFGWDADIARQFFGRSFSKRQVILVGGEPAGWLELSEQEPWIFLHEIGLMPAFRDKGIGTQVIEDLFAYADSKKYWVELQVLVTNPAQRLYERMGFRQTHRKMSRPAGGWKEELPALD